ncbi:MAG TPA: tRNA pseudouridine(55) synthase TruB [Chloroflexota bacterium]|nr:tRNA pseudouridine(55) synthase TruB [Chloroflexota bacterium]
MTQALSGILNVDKPPGWTSHDVVSLVRHLAGIRQVGHAGTLDPLATGVLLVCIGAATRLSDYLMHGRKCYLASLALGATTTTDDREGEVVVRRPIADVTRQRVLDILPAFVGAIEQIPPAFSAIKVGGVAAYRRARRGLAPELAPRTVRVEGLAVTALDGDTLTILVWCSAGTYIRSLARDIGEALGCGAHLAALRRLSSGGYSVAESRSLVALQDLAAAGRLSQALAPMDRAVCDWPVVILDDRAISQLAHGGLLAAPAPAGGGPTGARLMSIDGRLLGLAEYDPRRRGWQPRKVLDAAPSAGQTAPRAGHRAHAVKG